MLTSSLSTLYVSNGYQNDVQITNFWCDLNLYFRMLYLNKYFLTSVFECYSTRNCSRHPGYCDLTRNATTARSKKGHLCLLHYKCSAFLPFFLFPPLSFCRVYEKSPTTSPPHPLTVTYSGYMYTPPSVHRLFLALTVVGGEGGAQRR